MSEMRLPYLGMKPVDEVTNLRRQNADLAAAYDSLRRELAQVEAENRRLVEDNRQLRERAAGG